MNSNHDNVRVLLIEDDPDDAMLTQEFLLEAAGTFEVTWESDALAGLESLISNEHDICFLDYQLGAVTGLEILARAREGNTRVPVVMLTGAANPMVDLNATVAGASDFLDKRGINARALERVIRYTLARTRDEAKLREALRQVEEAHDQLRGQNEQLKTLGEFKNRMLGMAAHDLRTPLAAIGGWSHRLIGERAGSLNDEQRGMITRIQRSSDFMLTLVDELLDHATHEAQAVVLKRRLVEPESWLDTLVGRLAVKAESKEVNLRVELGDLPSTVEVDPEKLERAVSNLVGNAIKFAPAGSSVSVRADVTGPNLQIDVTDHGPGIADHDIAKIFRPFSKVRVPIVTGEKSTGLGLSIARQIVEAHRGTLDVHSIQGSGTTFTVRVPTGRPSDSRRLAPR